MKNLLLTIGALSLLLTTGCRNAEKENENEQRPNDSVSVAATSEPTVEAEAPADSAAMMKAWSDYMTPGPMHKWLATADGKWEAEVRSCTKPGGPLGEPSKANVENKMIMNGLYQETTYKGNMMGMPFEGKGIMAYDNGRKKFVSTWVDNMGSGVLHLEGNYDESSKTLDMKGKSTDPMTGGEEDFREVMRIIDEKNHVLEMYSQVNGKEFKMMEIKLAKK